MTETSTAGVNQMRLLYRYSWIFTLKNSHILRSKISGDGWTNGRTDTTSYRDAYCIKKSGIKTMAWGFIEYSKWEGMVGCRGRFRQIGWLLETPSFLFLIAIGGKENGIQMAGGQGRTRQRNAQEMGNWGDKEMRRRKDGNREKFGRRPSLFTVKV